MNLKKKSVKVANYVKDDLLWKRLFLKILIQLHF